MSGQPTVCCARHWAKDQPRRKNGVLAVKVPAKDGKTFCNECRDFKEPDQFQKRNGRPLSPCKVCRAKRCRKYVTDGLRKTAIDVVARRKRCAAWAKRNREKCNDRNSVQYALRTGKLKRLPCEGCGNPKTHAHHGDYSKRLDVKWLCVVCHKKEHRKYA